MQSQCYKENSTGGDEHGGSRESESESVTSFEDTYREIALNCFRYFDFKSFLEVDRLTIAEYKLLMEAAQLKQVDADYRNHLQAFLNFAVKAEKKTGKNKSKPVYRKFKHFYNYEEELRKVTNKDKKSRFAGIGKFLKKGV
jgi:hypothetical protein